MNKNVVRVDIKVRGEKLREMQARANERVAQEPEGGQGPPKSSVKLSRQDVLTAWVVLTLNKVLDRPIERLTNAASVNTCVLSGSHNFRLNVSFTVSQSRSPLFRSSSRRQ